MGSTARDADAIVRWLCLDGLRDEFDFVLDNEAPDYLVVEEHIYPYKRIDKERLEFLRLYQRATVRIFIEGEAIYPDFNVFDYAVGFHNDISIKGRYCRLMPPELHWPNFIEGHSMQNEIDSMEAAREELKRKTGFCSFLYSNGRAHPMRDKMFYALSDYKRVDSLGMWLNNTGKGGTGYGGHSAECIPLKAPYKFAITSENAQVNGYTSEKILTSLLAHSVPLYFGDPDIAQYINPDCFVDCNRLSPEEIVQRVKEIDEDDEKWCRMISAPYQTEEQIRQKLAHIKEYEDFFRNIFRQDIAAARRRPIGTHPDAYDRFFLLERVVYGEEDGQRRKDDEAKPAPKPETRRGMRWLVKKGVKFLCPYWVVGCVQTVRQSMCGQK